MGRNLKNMAKTKIKKTQPIFDKRQIKEMSDNYNRYKKILNPELLDTLLETEIKYRMLRHHVENTHDEFIYIIERQYSKELKMVYQAIKPEPKKIK